MAVQIAIAHAREIRDLPLVRVVWFRPVDMTIPDSFTRPDEPDTIYLDARWPFGEPVGVIDARNALHECRHLWQFRSGVARDTWEADALDWSERELAVVRRD